MGYKRLRIFDFDDTLVKTESFVYVENNNKINKLSPGEFAIYEEKPGDKFDFKEFEDVKNPKEIRQMTFLLKRILSKGRGGVYILTARGSYKPIRRYLKEINIDISRVYVEALASNNPQDKANWIKNKILNDGYNDIYYVDDSRKNIEAARIVLDKLKVNFKLQHVKY